MAWALILSVVPAAVKTFPVKQRAWNWTAYSSCCRETAAWLDASERRVCRTACVAPWKGRCTHTAFPGSPPSPQQQTRIRGAHHHGVCSLEAGASSVCQLAMRALIKVLLLFSQLRLAAVLLLVAAGISSAGKAKNLLRMSFVWCIENLNELKAVARRRRKSPGLWCFMIKRGSTVRLEVGKT